MPASEQRHPPVALVPLGVALLGLVLLLPRLSASGLWDPWEPRYAGTARAMLATGDWIVPRYLDAPRFVKPPLTYWLMAASRSILGEGEAASRLPSVLLAVVAAAGLAAAFVARGRALEGALAGAVLLTTPQWALLARAATPDVPLAACLGLLLALAIAAPAFGTTRLRRLGAPAVVLLLAAATLTDWPRGLVLPAWAVLGWAAVRGGRLWLGWLTIVGVVFAIAQRAYNVPLNLLALGLVAGGAAVALRRLAGIAWRTQLLAAVVVALIVAPWFIAVALLEPQDSLPRLFGYKYGLNLGESPGEHAGPFTFVLAVVAAGSLPWIGAALAGVVRGAARRGADDVAQIVAGAWLGPLLYFVLAEARMGHFYGVLQPALAGLAAVGLAALVRERGRGHSIATAGLLLATTLALVRPSLVVESLNVFSSLDGVLDPRPWIALSVAVWVAAAAAAILRRRPTAVLLATVVPAAVLSSCFTLAVVPALDGTKSARALWQHYLDERGAGEELRAVDWTKDSVRYYGGAEVQLLEEPTALQEFLRGSAVRWIIAPESQIAAVAELAGPSAEVRTVHASHPDLFLLRVQPATVLHTGRSRSNR